MTVTNVLGAETQAASSIAAAYPERSFNFVSDQRVIDGWDLPNVVFRHADPASWDHSPSDIAVCPRWASDPGRHAQSRLVPELSRHFPEYFTPLLGELPDTGRWIAKGDCWHRPDAPLSGTPEMLQDVVAPAGCRLVYQPLLPVTKRFAAIGHRGDDGVSLGILEILQERFFRDAILQAAETVHRPELADLSLAMVDKLDHDGYFTLSWLQTAEGLYLSSFRPVPRAVFGTFRRAGVDLLKAPRGTTICPAGFRFVGWPHYSSYGEPA